MAERPLLDLSEIPGPDAGELTPAPVSELSIGDMLKTNAMQALVTDPDTRKAYIAQKFKTTPGNVRIINGDDQVYVGGKDGRGVWISAGRIGHEPVADANTAAPIPGYDDKPFAGTQNQGLQDAFANKETGNALVEFGKKYGIANWGPEVAMTIVGGGGPAIYSAVRRPLLMLLARMGVGVGLANAARSAQNGITRMIYGDNATNGGAEDKGVEDTLIGAFSIPGGDIVSSYASRIGRHGLGSGFRLLSPVEDALDRAAVKGADPAYIRQMLEKADRSKALLGREPTLGEVSSELGTLAEQVGSNMSKKDIIKANLDRITAEMEATKRSATQALTPDAGENTTLFRRGGTVPVSRLDKTVQAVKDIKEGVGTSLEKLLSGLVSRDKVVPGVRTKAVVEPISGDEAISALTKHFPLDLPPDETLAKVGSKASDEINRTLENSLMPLREKFQALNHKVVDGAEVAGPLMEMLQTGAGATEAAAGKEMVGNHAKTIKDAIRMIPTEVVDSETGGPVRDISKSLLDSMEKDTHTVVPKEMNVDQLQQMKAKIQQAVREGYDAITAGKVTKIIDAAMDKATKGEHGKLRQTFADAHGYPEGALDIIGGIVGEKVDPTSVSKALKGMSNSQLLSLKSVLPDELVNEAINARMHQNILTTKGDGKALADAVSGSGELRNILRSSRSIADHSALEETLAGLRKGRVITPESISPDTVVPGDKVVAGMDLNPKTMGWMNQVFEAGNTKAMSEIKAALPKQDFDAFMRQFVGSKIQDENGLSYFAKHEGMWKELLGDKKYNEMLKGIMENLGDMYSSVDSLNAMNSGVKNAWEKNRLGAASKIMETGYNVLSTPGRAKAAGRASFDKYGDALQEAVYGRDSLAALRAFKPLSSGQRALISAFGTGGAAAGIGNLLSSPVADSPASGTAGKKQNSRPLLDLN